MSFTEQNTLPRRFLPPTWQTALSVCTVLVAFGAVILHLVGEIAHEAYLHYWGIDAGMFPKATDWLLMRGYFGLLDRSVVLLLAVKQNVWQLAGAVVVATLYVFFLLSPAGAGSGALPARLARLPRWIRSLVRYVVVAGLVVVAIPSALYIWTGLMVIPGYLGDAAGKAHAQREAVEYKKGCEQSKYPCVQLKKGGELLGSGFVLDGSPTHIAIFDAQLQRARVVPREAVEMISGRAPVLPADLSP